MPERQRHTTLKDRRLRKAQLWHAFWTIGVPCAVTIGACISLFWRWPGIPELIAFLLMWLVTGLGITVGYHRFLAHNAFQTSPILKKMLVIFGSMAGQGPPINWVSLHRRHHEHSDAPEDPHSPHMKDKARLDVLAGLWHAHVGWILDHDYPNPVHYAPDLLRDPLLVRVGRFYFVWLAVGVFGPAVFAGVWSQSPVVAGSVLVWAGLVRLFVMQNAIWSVNSICHRFGKQNFETREKSVNNIWLALPTLGEAWHNNHHAFSYSAMFGLTWWQLDIGGLFIRLLERCGLVWDVKCPTGSMIRQKLEQRAGGETI